MHMEKEKLLFKIRDYNNELEKILEKKCYTENAKNLLLSMLYKVETAYPDYRMVKRQTYTKYEYLERVIQTIAQDCRIIRLAKPKTEDSVVLEDAKKDYLVDPEKMEVYAYENEESILKGILEMAGKEKNYQISQELMKLPITDFLKKGEKREMQEAITDFNGWSWEIRKTTQEEDLAKICYINLVDLVGMEKIKQAEEKNDVLAFFYETLQNLYEEKLAKEFWITFLQNVLRIYAKKEPKYQKILEEKKKEWTEELAKMQDKVGFLDSLTKEKRKIQKEIAKIDLLLNNNDKLRKAYVETNQKLPNAKKHFSVSTFAEDLEKKRSDLLIELTEINELFEPKKFQGKRAEVQEKADFFVGIGTEDWNPKKEVCFAKLQQTFWKLLRQKIATATDKKELIDLIYEVRYYRIQKKERGIKEYNPQEEKKTKEELLEKALKMKVCNSLTKDEAKDKKILEILFDTKIVCLQGVSVTFEEQKEKTKVEIYDEKVVEDTIYLDKIDWKEKGKKKRKLLD